MVGEGRRLLRRTESSRPVVTLRRDGTVRQASPSIGHPSVPTVGRWAEVGLVGFTLAGGVAIFVGGTPYFEITAANDSPLYNAVLVAGFWLLARLLSRQPSLASYARCSHALFVAASAMLVLAIGPFNFIVTAADESVRQAVQDKLAQFLSVVPVILVLTWAGRRPFGWIYLQKGLPKRWLTFGLSWFAVSAVVITALALVSGIRSADLLSAAPSILVFAALNAVMEELWCRGIVLRDYAAAMGATPAVVVTAIVFAAGHVAATYVGSVGGQLLLVSGALAIGLVAAWAMRWADCLWGAVLFHMGLDLLVVFGLLDAA
jgi:membrane protease YdiL (CAAX protease family)